MAGTNGSKKRVSLDKILDDAGEVEIEGTWYVVKQLDGPGWELYDRIKHILMAAARKESVDLNVDNSEVYGMAKRVVPSCPEDVIMRLTSSKAGMILQIAAETLEEVELADPNVESRPGPSLTPSSA